MSELYAQDGVNLEVGDDFSAFAARMCRSTWDVNPFVNVRDFAEGKFRGPRGLEFVGLPTGCFLDVAPDGIGTKVTIITEALSHRTAARDVLAMTAGDITRYGGMVLAFSNVFDVKTLGEKGSPTWNLLAQAIVGLTATAREQGIVVYRGETAELGDCVSSENPDAVTHFNWAGFAIGVHHPDKILTGEKLRPGQPVMALKERGFRSNGISAVRTALRLKFGEGYKGKWWLNPDAKEAIRAAATPSTLYDRLLAEANGWYSPDFKSRIPVAAIAHITGGGIPSKFAEDILFPLGLCAALEDLYDPSQIMRDCAQWRGLSPYETYKVWHGGQGALVVLEQESDEEAFITLAKQHGTEAKRCGTILHTEEPILYLRSQFDGSVLEYTP